jgi:tetratricopeptide (TPR) repeat protein
MPAVKQALEDALKKYPQYQEEKSKREKETPKSTADEHFEKGTGFQAKNKFKEAISEYEKVVESDQNHYRAWTCMALSYGQLGNNEKAIECCQEAVRTNPMGLEAWLFMGFCYGGLGAYKQTIVACRKALELNPRSADAWLYMYMAYRGLGDMEKANDCIEKALNINPAFIQFEFYTPEMFFR